MAPSNEEPDPALGGVPGATAQRDLTACLEAGAAGQLTSGHWMGPSSRVQLVDPLPSYRVLIAGSDLHRALEDGLSTWLVGQGPSGQLVSGSLPRDPDNANGLNAWVGEVDGRPNPSGLTVEYLCGGIGSPNLDGTGTPVFAMTLIGRREAGIARVTAHYQGQPEQDAVATAGVWFSQVQRGPGAGALTVHGYDADGNEIALRSLD